MLWPSIQLVGHLCKPKPLRASKAGANCTPNRCGDFPTMSGLQRIAREGLCRAAGESAINLTVDSDHGQVHNLWW